MGSELVVLAVQSNIDIELDDLTEKQEQLDTKMAALLQAV